MSGFDATRFPDRPVTAVAITGSTSDDALAAARAGAPHGAVFVADAQTAGRGRRGRSWASAPGAGLLFSVVLRPRLAAACAPPLTLALGLAVRATLASYVAAPVGIKWPNDLLVAGKKLAGILCETQLGHGEVGAVVVGVGINVASVPHEVAGSATSLAELGAEPPGREALLAELLRAIEARLSEFSTSGLGGMLPELCAHDALLGKRVRVGDVSGVASGIDADGALLLDAGRRVTAGSVTLL